MIYQVTEEVYFNLTEQVQNYWKIYHPVKLHSIEWFNNVTRILLEDSAFENWGGIAAFFEFDVEPLCNVGKSLLHFMEHYNRKKELWENLNKGIDTYSDYKFQGRANLSLETVLADLEDMKKLRNILSPIFEE